MDTGDQQAIDRQSLIGLAIVFIVLFSFMWWYSSYQAAHPESPGTSPSPAATNTELKVVPGEGSPTETGNPQQAANPGQSSASDVQSGQPNLQPSANANESLKQEYGL